jgi:hypothetical protein
VHATERSAYFQLPCFFSRLKHGLQSCVRVLKEEATSVKVLYLGMFSCVGTTIAMLITGDATWPSWRQATLLLMCGVASHFTLMKRPVPVHYGTGRHCTACARSPASVRTAEH